MADELTERPLDAGVVGVRFPGSSQVQFFASGALSLDVGMWVACSTEGGEQAGRVVIAPLQVLMAQLDADLPYVQRVLSIEDVERLGRGWNIAPRTTDEAAGRLVGGLGFVGRSRDGLSHEDEAHRKRKRDLPRLGQRIATSEGDGVVVALQVMNGLVTVRHDAPLREQTYSMSELPGWLAEEQPRPDDDERSPDGPLTGHADTAG